MNDCFDDFVRNAINPGKHVFFYDSPKEGQHLLSEFNFRIANLLDEFGVESIGEAAWYLYSCASGITFDATNVTERAGIERFVASLRTLYDDGFCRVCKSCRGHSDVDERKFSTACYMLWDLDSGLQALFESDDQLLLKYGDELLEFGLTHPHLACQESFLHGLGHLQETRPEYAQIRIETYLSRDDIPMEMRNYAKNCAIGNIL